MFVQAKVCFKFAPALRVMAYGVPDSYRDGNTPACR